MLRLKHLVPCECECASSNFDTLCDLVGLAPGSHQEFVVIPVLRYIMHE